MRCVLYPVWSIVKSMPNHQVLRTGGSRCGLTVVGALARLPPVADLCRSPTLIMRTSKGLHP